MTEPVRGEFEIFLKRALEELDPAPPAPREEMWAHIEQQRRFMRGKRPQSPALKWLSWGVGLAAMLAVGIGIGRLTMRQQTPSATDIAATAPAPVNRAAYGVVVSDHMTKAEALFTSFRTQPSNRVDPDLARWAQDLLTNTRLLLDSPAADDPTTAQLLEDLELIIAQIARVSEPSRVEKEIIEEGMKKTAVMSRLRAGAPAGT